jgi:hypothetical protein
LRVERDELKLGIEERSEEIRELKSRNEKLRDSLKILIKQTRDLDKLF